MSVPKVVIQQFLGARVHVFSFASSLSGNLDIFSRVSARQFLILAMLSVDVWFLQCVFHRDDMTRRDAIVLRAFSMEVV
jgi:hypothetical protein